MITNCVYKPEQKELTVSSDVSREDAIGHGLLWLMQRTQPADAFMEHGSCDRLTLLEINYGGVVGVMSQPDPNDPERIIFVKDGKHHYWVRFVHQ